MCHCPLAGTPHQPPVHHTPLEDPLITEQQALDALPSQGFVRNFVDYASRCTDANLGYHIVGALSCLSQAVPSEYCVPYASPIYGNLYSMIVGGSSKSRKTASLNIARRVIYEAIPDSIGEIPGSQEGLYESLRGQPRQLIVYGEWGEFLAKAEEGYLMAMKTAYTSAWDCVPIGRALAKSKKGNIENPRLSLLTAVATDLLERHTEMADWTGGFLARFLTIYGEPEREFATPPVDNLLARRNMVSWLAGLATPPAAMGACLWLDDPAQVMWKEWYESLRPMREGASRRAQAACSRASAIAAKVALLLAWDIGEARSGEDWHVGIDVLEPALKITNLHVASVLELGERVTGTKDMRDRATVLRAIQLVPTPIGVILRDSEMLKRRCKEILESLEEERMIQPIRVNDVACYQQTPQAAALLAQFVHQGREAAEANEYGGAQVVALPPPKLPPMAPEADVIDDLDLESVYDVDWSRYEG